MLVWCGGAATELYPEGQEGQGVQRKARPSVSLCSCLMSGGRRGNRDALWQLPMEPGCFGAPWSNVGWPGLAGLAMMPQAVRVLTVFPCTVGGADGIWGDGGVVLCSDMAAVMQYRGSGGQLR